jgi:hypothetical protein
LRGISRKPPEEWAQVELARYLNRTLGTHLAPWDLDDVPEVWIALIVAGSEMRADLAEQGLIK